MKKYKWGILGPGRIAQKFASDLQRLPNAELYAVASTSMERAKDFAEKFEVPVVAESYVELADLEELDIIYIATPHAYHCEHTMLCLKSGRNVLCEKPFAMNLAESKQMVAVAKQKGLFLMEAMWTRFIPLFEKTLEIIQSGRIGELQAVQADFGFKADYFSKESRIWNSKLGGGVLLDIGVYPLYLMTRLFGRPISLQANATFSDTGVDDNVAAILGYADKKMGLLHASFTATTPTEAQIFGTMGRIQLHNRFHHPKKITIVSYDGQTEDIEMPYEGFGYQFEAARVMECLDAGLTECPEHDLEFTLLMMELLDAVGTAMRP